MGTAPLGLRTMFRMKEKVEKPLPRLEGGPEGVVREIWATCTLSLARTCKNQQTIAC